MKATYPKLTGCSLLALATMIPAGQTLAQQNASADDALLEIIVTAQRRQERMQEIPVAISAFGAAQLEQLGVASIENIAPRIPSVYFGSFGALRPQLYIRGIGTRSFDPGSESSVGVFADEVYLGRSSGSFGAMKDVERAEVLRGPQGTLYGRNTIGGAINVITKAPTPEFTGDAEIGVSNFNGYELFGAVGGPVTEDGKLMFRVAGWHTERDGYVTNLATGNKFQGVDNSGARGRLTFQPTEVLSIDLTAEYLHDGDKAAFAGFNQGTGPSATGAPANPRTVFFAAASRLPNQVLPESLRRGRWSADPTLDRDAYAYIGRVELETETATITSISALRKLDVADSRDLEGSSLDILFQDSKESSKQFTQELRLTSNPDGPASFGGKLDWIVGAFYYHDSSDRTDMFRVGVDSAVRAAAGTPAFDTASSDYRIESYALFGQATWHATEQFEVTLGGRYSKDKKRARQTGATTDALPIIPAAFDVTNRAEYSSFDPRVVATYKFTPDVNVYASYSTGFKSGGFQYVPFNAASANTLFDPEDIKTYEVGLKSDWLDRRLRVNMAGFYYDYRNLQVSRIIDTPSGPQTLISNAATSTVKGIEVEMFLRPIRNVELSATYGYLDATYDKYVFNLGQNLVFDGTALVRAPKNTLNLGAEWTIPVDDNRLTLRADYAVLSKFYHEPGEGNAIYGSGIPLTREAGYGLLDLRTTYQMDAFRINIYATNVTNKKYRRTVNALGNTIIGFAGQPSIYGVKLGYSF